ncbi:hypothetical protein ALC62_03200 [Cyphomyrmex costatus]|uniref:Uncharacterized protein n=1 Tax=Cyphomyrmex costatus TaxID=456900 RepID=A0A151ILX1_9HYME|nr:hypothetical protein ALC62_03200 [Cyphomyrmex costatus]
MTPGSLGNKNSRRFNGSGSSGIHQKGSAEYNVDQYPTLGPLDLSRIQIVVALTSSVGPRE